MPASEQRTLIRWLIAAIALFIAGAVLFVYFDVQGYLLDALAWVEAQGAWGPIIVFAMVVVAVVFILPGIVFTLGSGFLFGVVTGATVIILATTLGAAIAFLIARYFFSEGAQDYLRNHERLAIIQRELAGHGWKVVMLTRLVPFFPFKLSNYFFGITDFNFRDFIVGTFLGIIPYSLLNVYIGSLASDLATIGQGERSRTTLEWIIYGLGFLAAVVAVFQLTRIARQALAKHINSEDLRGTDF